MRTIRRFTTLVLLLAGALAVARCLVAELASAPRERFPEIAREIELVRTPDILRLLSLDDTSTTELVDSGFPYRWLPSWAKPHRSKLLSWDSLSQRAQVRLLHRVSQSVDFSQSRTVPRFSLKREVRVRADGPFTFLGRDYPAGESTIDLRGFLEPYVEYAGTQFVEDASAFELHFRSRLPPSQLRKEIQTFLTKIVPDTVTGGSTQKGLPITHAADHQHIPAERPIAFFSDLKDEGFDPEVGPTILSLYHMAAELSLVMENAKHGYYPTVRLNPYRSKPPLMDYLHPDGVKEIHSFFSALARGENPAIGVSLKKNNVGLRGHDTYTDPSLWGLELRFPNFEVTRHAGYGEIADGIQRTLHAQDFPIDPKEVASFVRRHSGRVDDALASLWFRRDARPLLADLSGSPLLPDVRRAMVAWKYQRSDPEPWETYSFTALLPVLFVNWEENPIVSGDPALRKKVVEVQREVLRASVQAPKTSDSARKLVFDFFGRSGLQSRLDQIIKRTDGKSAGAADAGEQSSH